jgi:hypothetical protein
MSYISFGSGPESRNAQFIVHQCVHILYAFRVFYLHHCLEVVHPSRTAEPERLSNAFLNSNQPSAFTAVQNIKRPAKLDIPECGVQKITWLSSDCCDSLSVHVGVMGLDRVLVSHAIMRSTFFGILQRIRATLTTIGIEIIKIEEFRALRDSASSTHPGEGLWTFNPCDAITKEFVRKSTRGFRHEFLKEASKLYRLTLAAIHLCGGPSPRATEDAVTRLLNSSTELVRNVQFIAGTIGVQSG